MFYHVKKIKLNDVKKSYILSCKKNIKDSKAYISLCKMDIKKDQKYIINYIKKGPKIKPHKHIFTYIKKNIK